MIVQLTQTPTHSRHTETLYQEEISHGNSQELMVMKLSAPFVEMQFSAVASVRLSEYFT